MKNIPRATIHNMHSDSERKRWAEDSFGIDDAGPFGGADDIPAEIWGDPETFNAESAAKIVTKLIAQFDDEVFNLPTY